MKNPFFARRPLLAVVAAFLSFFTTGCERNLPPPRAAANDFLQAISEGRFQAAYDSTAFAFQAKTNFENFRSAARALNLTESPISCQWKEEEKPDTGEVKLTGELTVPDGNSLTLILTLIKERGAWRLYSLHDTANPAHKEADRFSIVGKTPSLTQLSPPSEANAQKLVRGSVLLFNDAITHNNFGNFYAQVSTIWQKQLTIGQLKRNFQPFVDAKVDLQSVTNLPAVFKIPPEVDEQGVLLLKGHYDTQPGRTLFALRYVYEFPYWKLLGISIEIAEASSSPAAKPSPETAPSSSPLQK